MCALRIGMYSDKVCYGGITFNGICEGAPYHLSPPNLLTQHEVEEVRLVLCRLPQINQGQVGKYEWRLTSKREIEATANKVV